jgi:4-amino-4-deoxy-L-arabinose transferase-like glycosyltransferase
VYLPGLFATPPIDRDEARFAQASRQMFESVALPAERRDAALHGGGLAVPMVGDLPRLNKPPLVYWAQALSAAAFTVADPSRDAIWMYRVPSVLGAIAAVLGTWWAGCSMLDRRAGVLGAALLGVSAVVVFDAHQARADQLLLGATAWAMALIWSLARAAHLGQSAGVWRWAAAWAVVGLGLLAKGVTPLVAVAAIGAACLVGRSWSVWRSTRPVLGLVLVGVVALPWCLGVVGQVGLDRYLSVVINETVGRGTSAREGHAGPPGYHLALLAAVCWPGSLLVPLGVWHALRRGPSLGPRGSRWSGRRPGRFAERFLVCWIVPTWIFFEVYSTKLPHYVLPVYPALALLAARGGLASAAAGRRALVRLGAGVFTLIGVALPIAAVVLSVVVEGIAPPLAAVAPVALAMLALVVIAFRRTLRRGPGAGAVPAVLAMAPLAWLIHGLLLPRLTTLSPRVVETLEGLGGGSRPLACCGYQEDSLVFLLRGAIPRLTPEEATDWLRATPDGLLVIRPGDRLADDGFSVAATVRGYHFANGRVIDVQILETGP